MVRVPAADRGGDGERRGAGDGRRSDPRRQPRLRKGVVAPRGGAELVLPAGVGDEVSGTRRDVVHGDQARRHHRRDDHAFQARPAGALGLQALGERQGRGGDRDGDEHRAGDHQRVVGDGRRDVQRGHHRVVGGDEREPLERAADRQRRRAACAAVDVVQRTRGADDRGDRGDGEGDRVLGHRQPGVQGQQRHEVHRPDAQPDDERPGGQPGPAGRTVRGAHAAGAVEHGVGHDEGENRHS